LTKNKEKPNGIPYFNAQISYPSSASSWGHSTKLINASHNGFPKGEKNKKQAQRRKKKICVLDFPCHLLYLLH